MGDSWLAIYTQPLSRALEGFTALPKDTVTVNTAADGQVIAVEELSLLVFWLRDITHRHQYI